MICNQRGLLIPLIICGFLLPAGLKAQEANHCVARESPKKMAIGAGKLIYASKCVTCHQEDGGGSPNLNPSLIKTRYVLGNKQALIEGMLRGMNHEEINGRKYQNTMPLYAEMTDQELANLLTYIRHNFGNKASVVKPSEVKAIREIK